MAKRAHNLDVFEATGELHIHDGNWERFVEAPRIGGKKLSKGLIPRDRVTTFYPAEKPGLEGLDIKEIPQNEWSDRIRQQEKDQSRLSDIRNQGKFGQRMPSTDQNGEPYCWMHSGTSGMLIVRARMNQPYADLSAFGPACKVMNFRSSGGWGAQGLDFLTKYGCTTSEVWPQRSKDRKLDNPETWAHALKYRFVEAWNDLSQAQYDRNLTFRQTATCLLSNIPVIVDFNWWGHSVCALDLVETSSGSFGLRIWNSWGDGWSEGGTGILSGSRAIPDGSTAPREVIPTA